eukprot:12603868-Ditylum_brightwellii.AAC.1
MALRAETCRASGVGRKEVDYMKVITKQRRPILAIRSKQLIERQRVPTIRFQWCTAQQKYCA